MACLLSYTPEEAHELQLGRLIVSIPSQPPFCYELLFDRALLHCHYNRPLCRPCHIASPSVQSIICQAHHS